MRSFFTTKFFAADEFEFGKWKYCTGENRLSVCVRERERAGFTSQVKVVSYEETFRVVLR